MKKTRKIEKRNLSIIKNSYLLAPMHEVNDIAFRILCKKAGAGLTYTGLINPQMKKEIFLNDKPALQFACNSKKGIKEFIKKYDKKISSYDFNLGCPSNNAKKSKIGYFMIQDYNKIEDILKEIKRYTKKPLTIKIRKMPMKNTRRIIKITDKYCNAIIVHPRTLKQGYSGIPDMDFARKIRKLTTLPIIYSGNIETKEQADKVLKEFYCVMIGRKAIGNPNIFYELNDKKTKSRINFKDYLKLALKYKIKFSQIKFQAINFTRNFPGASKTREKIAKAKNLEELRRII